MVQVPGLPVYSHWMPCQVCLNTCWTCFNLSRADIFAFDGAVEVVLSLAWGVLAVVVELAGSFIDSDPCVADCCWDSLAGLA